MAAGSQLCRCTCGMRWGLVERPCSALPLSSHPRRAQASSTKREACITGDTPNQAPLPGHHGQGRLDWGQLALADGDLGCACRYGGAARLTTCVAEEGFST